MIDSTFCCGHILAMKARLQVVPDPEELEAVRAAAEEMEVTVCLD